jgi:hypothetical protein
MEKTRPHWNVGAVCMSALVIVKVHLVHLNRYAALAVHPGVLVNFRASRTILLMPGEIGDRTFKFSLIH